MKVLKCCQKALICLAISSYITNANATVRITEIMTNNVATVISDTYNYDGYVEFYNDGGNFNLNGWTVTNTKKGELNWSVKLKSDYILPNGYSLLFFGKNETNSSEATKVQYNYVGSIGEKLSTDEGSLSFEKNGEKMEITYPNQYPHISYCENGFMMPTPGKENDRLVTSINNRVATPTFKSGIPGIYENRLNVELECKTDGARIYYTTNGDIPTPEKGTLYNGTIQIDSTTGLRAKAYKDGMLFSEIMTGSYILPDKFHSKCVNTGENLPVVSITANHNDLFGDMLGIYVEGTNGIANSCTPKSNYNQDWTRSANFEYIIDGKVVDNQEVEIGVYGGCTRVYIGKSLKIKANKRSGNNKMQYNKFFADRSYKKYKSLALRNGGNGYSYVQPRWRDMFIQSLADGMDIDKQSAQPVAFYLNGIYYGMMILTERTDEDYVYHNYGLDEDEIDLLKGVGGYICEKGTIDAYNDMIDYVSQNYANSDFYDKLNTHMDIDEYINYQILEQYCGNKDWISNNIKLWRKHDGGRFRWIAYDTDFGMSERSSSLDINMLDFATKPIKTNYTPALILMQSCMKNEDFRWKFLDEYLDKLENQFTDDWIDTKLDSIHEITEFEMCATIKNSKLLKCPGSIDDYKDEIEGMRSFAKERKKYIVSQLKNEYGLGDNQVEIKIRAVFPEEENPDFKFLFNKRECNGVKYNTTRYSNERIKIEPIIPVGYRILRWLVNDELVRADNGNKYIEKDLTTVANSGDLKISIFFEHDPNYVVPTGLCLNEVCTSNESYLDENGEASDWIELYNNGDKDIDITGMTIENQTKAVKYTIPAGKDNETKISAHGYKLLWADKKTDLGPLHLNFKLSASTSEKITLRAFLFDKEVELSSLTYTPLNTDESYGRETDGSTTMKVFDKCTDDNGDSIKTYTPNSANGSVTCPSSNTTDQSITDKAKTVYAKGNTVYVHNAKEKDVRVYSLLGNVVANKKTESELNQITITTPGIYLVKVDTECWKIVIENK